MGNNPALLQWQGLSVPEIEINVTVKMNEFKQEESLSGYLNK